MVRVLVAVLVLGLAVPLPPPLVSALLGEVRPMTDTMRWALVRPVRRLPRPVGYWARFGRLEATGYGGRLCSDARHPVYLAERGEPNRQGERERFHVCAVCNAVGGEEPAG